MEKETRRTIKHWLIVGGLFGGVIIAEIVNIRVIERYYDKLERASFFGGYHGAISAVFTGLAAAFTLYLIFLQKEEIQQNELDRRTDEEKRTVSEFETRFFKIIEIWRKSVDNLYVARFQRDPSIGIDFFRTRLDTLNYRSACAESYYTNQKDEAIVAKMYTWCHLANTPSSKRTVIHVDMSKAEAEDALQKLIEDECMNCADPYIKLFIETLRQISTNIEKDSVQVMYSSLLTSVMTDEELYFLHYVSFSKKWPTLKGYMDSLDLSLVAEAGLERDYRVKLIKPLRKEPVAETTTA